MAALGMETASGDFEVIDICYAGLPPLASPSETHRSPLTERGKGKAKANGVDDEDMEVNEDLPTEGPVWVALVSGVSAGSDEVPEDLKLQLLVEWLMGEAGGVDVSRVGEGVLDRNDV